MTSFNFLYLSEDDNDNDARDDDNDDDTVCEPVFSHSNKEPSGNNRPAVRMDWPQTNLPSVLKVLIPNSA